MKKRKKERREEKYIKNKENKMHFHVLCCFSKFLFLKRKKMQCLNPQILRSLRTTLVVFAMAKILLSVISPQPLPVHHPDLRFAHVPARVLSERPRWRDGCACGSLRLR